MFDREQLLDRLNDVLEALERIPYRFKSIEAPEDFIADEDGREHLDSICMILVAVGEAFRQIDAKTSGEWRTRYPQLPWAELIGVRNVIAHGYFDIDHEQVFGICEDDIPGLIRTVRLMVEDMR